MLLIFSILIFGLAFVHPVHAVTPTVSVYPSTVTACAGQNFSIDIRIANVFDLYGWEFKLGWNSTLLDAIKVTEGNFLKRGGNTFFWSRTNNTEGYILADCTLLGNVPGVSGSGTLVTIEFHAEVPGQSVLDLYDTMLINSEEVAIPHTANDGTVTVEPLGKYDLDGDGDIDIFDIAIVAKAYEAQRIGGEYWHNPPCPFCPHDPKTDIDEDGDVDIFDVSEVAKRYMG